MVEGRQFRTQSDYARALHDRKIIEELRAKKEFGSKAGLENLLGELEAGKYRFMTILGEDFREEVQEALAQAEHTAGRSKKTVGRFGKKASAGSQGSVRETKCAAPGSGKHSAGPGRVRQTGTEPRPGGSSPGRDRAQARGKLVRQGQSPGPGGVRQTGTEPRPGGSLSGRDRAQIRQGRVPQNLGGGGKTGEQQGNKPDDKLSEEMKAYVQEELKRQEKRRKRLILLCSAVAVCCLGYFGVYSWHHYKTGQAYDKLSQLKEMPVIGSAEVTPPTGPLFTLDEPTEPREVLDEYKNLLNKNKKLIGWVKIDDTNIDYPVMQTSDNEYYLTHNLNQENDRNGSIFMDKDCDVLKPSTNYIIYGHHMKSGNMFGKLDLYQDENYCKEHPYIQFDTIYEKGTYEVMYVFRSRVYREEEIVFKYYQFIDANSEQEFDSYMSEMASMSLYDTGVTAEYGDQLLTLSTCDYQEKNGRFVVVAKKVKE